MNNGLQEGNGTFQRIAEAVSRTMNLPVAVWLLDEQTQMLRIKAAVGLRPEYRDEAALAVDEPSVTGEAFRNNDIAVSLDIPSDKRWKYKKEAALMGWKSTLCVPIAVQDMVIGVISIYTFVARDFSDLEKQLLRDYAAQLGLSLEAERRQLALSRLLETGQEIEQLIVKQPRVVLDRIVKGACEVTGADCAVLYPYDPRREDFYDVTNVAAHGLVNPLNLSEKPRTKTGMAAFVQREGEVVLWNVEEQDPKMLETSPFIQREEIKAFMGIALQVAGDTLGILYVDFRSPHRFSEEEKKTIRLFAHQASIAIQNARFIEQRRVLQHIARDTTSILDKDRLMQSVLDHSLDLLGADFGSICLLNRRTNELEFQYARGKEKHLVIPLGKGLIGTAAQLRAPVRVEDVTSDQRYIAHIPETRSELDVPLLLGDTLVGVLNAESKKLGAFSLGEEDLAVLLADQAAVAIQNTRLFERLEALVRLSAVVTSHLDLEQMLHTILDGALELVECPTGSIGLLDHKTDQLEFRYIVGEQQHSLPLADGFTGLAVERKKPVRIGDVSKAERYYDQTKNTLSELTVPLIVGEEVIGVFNIESPLRDAFTDEDEEILVALASQAAIAIRNAQRVRTLEVLGKIGQSLTAGLRLEEAQVLELIHEQTKELMDASNMFIALYDEAADVVRFGLAYVNGERVDTATAEGWQPRKAGQGRTEWIIRNRKPLFHPTKAEGEKWYAEPGHLEYIGAQALGYWGSWIGVPMQVGEKVLGVIAAYHPEREYIYDEDDLQVLSSMASQTAIALDNSRLYYDVNQRLKVLVKLGQSLTSSFHLQEAEILDLIHSWASKLMDASNMFIALYDEAADVVRFGLAYVNGERVDTATAEGWQPRKAGQGRTEWIIRNRKPLFHPTKAEGEKWYAEPGHQEYVGAKGLSAWGSWIGVPMQVGEKVLGVIAAYHPEREYIYDEDDLQVLSSMASQTAIALDNSRLYYEAIADQKLKALGTVTATLQHRMNNTFTIIVPNIGLLKRLINMNDPTIAEIVDIIERNARLASDVISRIQASLKETALQEVDVNAALNHAVNTAKELRKGPTHPIVTVTLNLDDSIPLIYAPIGQMTEVFHNLVDNAYQAMPKGGYLVVSSCAEKGEIHVRIQDTGIGISPEIQQRLFRQPVPSKELGGGAGLGLWLGQLVLQSVGGCAIIEQTSDQGTTMLVRIPLAAARGREVPAV